MHCRRTVALAVALWFAVAASHAHEIKVFSSRNSFLSGGGKATVYLSWGHRVPVDDLVDATALDRYELVHPDGKTTALARNGVSLQANAIGVEKDGVHAVVVSRKASIFTYVLDDEGNKQLKRGPKSSHAKSKIDSATRSQQTGKTLIVVGKPGDTAPKSLGLPVEITPLDGPSKWTAKQDLRFQVLVAGKPAATAEVKARTLGFKPDEAWSYATTSNRNGEFSVRPSEAGTWVIKVGFKRLANETARQEYDMESYTTTLTLEVQP